MIFCGIDVGLNGGISVLDDNQRILFKTPMPVLKSEVKREYDLSSLIKIFKHILSLYPASQVRCILEKQTPHYAAGKQASYLGGFGYGLIQGVLATLGISFEVILAAQWQSEIFKGLNIKDTKIASIQYCQRKYPNEDFRASPNSTNASDGITDSVCIATYCWNRYKGEAIAYG